MTKNITGQEVLLNTVSSFAQRDLCKNDLSIGNNSSASQAEKLEEACWIGLLEDLLKRAIASNRTRQKLFLWKIRVADTFLYIQLSQPPSPLSQYHSLNPYIFLPLKYMN
ncbi:MAG: hypothetical protein ACHQFX_04020 [Chitinophagales bacterium]